MKNVDGKSFSVFCEIDKDSIGECLNDRILELEIQEEIAKTISREIAKHRGLFTKNSNFTSRVSPHSEQWRLDIVVFSKKDYLKWQKLFDKQEKELEELRRKL